MKKQRRCGAVLVFFSPAAPKFVFRLRRAFLSKKSGRFQEDSRKIPTTQEEIPKIRKIPTFLSKKSPKNQTCFDRPEKF